MQISWYVVQHYHQTCTLYWNTNESFYTTCIFCRDSGKLVSERMFLLYLFFFSLKPQVSKNYFFHCSSRYSSYRLLGEPVKMPLFINDLVNYTIQGWSVSTILRRCSSCKKSTYGLWKRKCSKNKIHLERCCLTSYECACKNSSTLEQKREKWPKNVT